MTTTQLKTIAGTGLTTVAGVPLATLGGGGISIVGAAHNALSTLSTTPSLTMPAGIQAGDIALYLVSSAVGSQSYTFTGWAQVGSDLVNGTTLISSLFQQTMAGTESGTAVGPTLGTNGRWNVQCIVLRGASAVLDSTGSVQKTSSTDVSTVTMAGVTPVVDGCLALEFAAAKTSGTAGVVTAWDSPAGWTQQSFDQASPAVSAVCSAIYSDQVVGGAGVPISAPVANVTNDTVSRQNVFGISVAPV